MRVCNRFVGTQVLRAAGICAMKAPTSGAAAAVTATATATAAPNPCEGQLSVFLSEIIPGGSEMRSICRICRLCFLRSDFVGFPCLPIKAQVLFFLSFFSSLIVLIFPLKIDFRILIT